VGGILGIAIGSRFANSETNFGPRGWLWLTAIQTQLMARKMVYNPSAISDGYRKDTRAVAEGCIDWSGLPGGQEASRQFVRSFENSCPLVVVLSEP